MRMAPLVCFRERRLPTEPGSGNYALCPTHTLPRGSFGGAGRGYTVSRDMITAFAATQPAPLYYGQDQVIIGLEGVPYYGINPTPLTDFEGN